MILEITICDSQDGWPPRNPEVNLEVTICASIAPRGAHLGSQVVILEQRQTGGPIAQLQVKICDLQFRGAAGFSR